MNIQVGSMALWTGNSSVMPLGSVLSVADKIEFTNELGETKTLYAYCLYSPEGNTNPIRWTTAENLAQEGFYGLNDIAFVGAAFSARGKE